MVTTFEILELFSTTSKWLRNAFSAQHSGGAWRDVLQPANHAQILNTLGWAGWVLRAFDDQEIDGAALEDLLASVGELERILAHGGLSPAIHDLLARQVAELRRALRLYTIQGSGPLRQAYSGGVAGLMTVPAEAVDELTSQDGPAMRKSVDVLERVGKAAKVGTDLLKFFTDLAGASNSAISHITQLLLPGPGG